MLFQSRTLAALAAGYLVFALVVTMAIRFPDFGNLLPGWLLSAFPPDKTNLAPHRFVHFLAIALIAARFIPKQSPVLEWRLFAPAIICGRQSLAVFCVGTLLSFIGHFALTLSSGAFLVQLVIALSGIALMCAVAYYITWSKRQDKVVSQQKRKQFEPGAIA
jgi:hypothetical protein